MRIFPEEGRGWTLTPTDPPSRCSLLAFRPDLSDVKVGDFVSSGIRDGGWLVEGFAEGKMLVRGIRLKDIEQERKAS